MKHWIDDDLSTEQIENLINLWIVGRNAKRNRVIMRLRLIDGLTYEQIANVMDMSPRGIVKIVYKCLAQMAHK